MGHKSYLWAMTSRLFPPIASLRALESAVRLGGFSAAALELGVSQSAVSQGVRQLERQLGVAMFVRSPGRVLPTEMGRRYAQAVAPALAALADAARAAVPEADRVIAFGCSRALLNHWLLPRLSRKPDRSGTVEVVALERAPKDLMAFHLAIVNDGVPDGMPGAELLRREHLVAVGTPELVRAAGGPLERSVAAADAPFLGGGWDVWSAASGAPRPRPGAVRLRETSALIAAARAGEGFVLLPSLVCADDIEGGRLAVASTVAVDSGRGYWLIQPRGRQDHVAPFAAWLRETFAVTKTDPRPPIAHA